MNSPNETSKIPFAQPLLTIAEHCHSTNLTGMSTEFIASIVFNEHPKPLHIAGTREAASGLFELLAKQSTPETCGRLFQDYMCVVFGFESEQRLTDDATGGRRYRNSYLRLIQDWGMDSNNAQSAVFKGWVESRFGLFPSYHKQAITGFGTQAWIGYIEEKMNSRYHNNCIYMQLDLLYEYCQWIIERFRVSATGHKTLYRGVNTLDDIIIRHENKHDKIVRFNNLVSFTDRPGTASEFGSYILKTNVPMVKLIFFNDLLPYHALRGEAEYLAIGGAYRVRVSY